MAHGPSDWLPLIGRSWIYFHILWTKSNTCLGPALLSHVHRLLIKIILAVITRRKIWMNCNITHPFIQSSFHSWELTPYFLSLSQPNDSCMYLSLRMQPTFDPPPRTCPHVTHLIPINVTERAKWSFSMVSFFFSSFSLKSLFWDFIVS